MALSFLLIGITDTASSNYTCKLIDSGHLAERVEKGEFVFKTAIRTVKVLDEIPLREFLLNTDFKEIEWQLLNDGIIESSGILIRESNDMKAQNDLLTLRCHSDLKRAELTYTKGLIYQNQLLGDIIADLLERSGLEHEILVNERLNAINQNYVISFISLNEFPLFLGSNGQGEYIFQVKNESGNLSNYYNLKKTNASNFDLGQIKTLEFETAILDPFPDSVSVSNLREYQKYQSIRQGRPSYHISNNVHLKLDANKETVNLYSEFGGASESPDFIEGLKVNTTIDDLRYHFFPLANNTVFRAAVFFIRNQTGTANYSFEAYLSKNVGDDGSARASSANTITDIPSNDYTDLLNVQVISSSDAKYLVVECRKAYNVSDFKYYLYKYEINSSNVESLSLVHTKVVDQNLAADSIYDDPNDESKLIGIVINSTKTEIRFVHYDKASFLTDLSLYNEDFDQAELIYKAPEGRTVYNSYVSSTYNTVKDEWLFSIRFQYSDDTVTDAFEIVSFTYSKVVYTYLENYEAGTTAMESLIDLAKSFNCVLTNSGSKVKFISRDAFFNPEPVLTISHYQSIKEQFITKRFDYVKVNDEIFPDLSESDIEANYYKGLVITVNGLFAANYLRNLAENHYYYFKEYRGEISLACNLIAQAELADLNLLDIVLFREKKSLVVGIQKSRKTDLIKIDLMQVREVN